MNIYGILILKNKIHLTLLTLVKDYDKFVWVRDRKLARLMMTKYVRFDKPTYAIRRQTINRGEGMTQKVTRFDFLEGDLDNPITNLKPYVYNCRLVW